MVIRWPSVQAGYSPILMQPLLTVLQNVPYGQGGIDAGRPLDSLNGVHFPSALLQYIPNAQAGIDGGLLDEAGAGGDTCPG